MFIVISENPISFVSSDENSPLTKPNILLVSTDGATYVYFVTEGDITALSVAGLFVDSVSPDKINPIPYYYFLIILFIVLILPTPKH